MARCFRCSPDTVAETADGRLQGFFLDGIYAFHGVKYADAQRFQPPVPSGSWEGVRDATNYGYICPVNSEPLPAAEILIPHRFWPANEHCQYLNVWTPTLDSAALKPVIVWLHGGGFANGSAIEQVAYEGDALAQFADAVVITLNHRLNILGFLDMSSFGERYANSVNAGMADIVEALHWIRRNIAAFGGDPQNVTLVGQSGGGGKISALLQIPAAAGLFHRAVIMSGIFEGKGLPTPDHREVVLDVMRELGISCDEPEKLEKTPYPMLNWAYSKVALKLLRTEKKLINWGPVPNGWYLGDPMVTGFSEYAKTVPIIAGTVVSEFSMRPGIQGAERLFREEKISILERSFGEKAEDLARLFESAYPGRDILQLLKLDVGTRRATVRYAEEKVRVSSAPTYLYMFAPVFDVNGPRPAWHCSDIPFVFHNTARVPSSNNPQFSDRLEEQIAGALAAFARRGDPNHPGLIPWPACGEGKTATMIFDSSCRIGNDYDRKLIEELHAVTLPGDPAGYSAMLLEAVMKEQGSEWVY